MMLATGSLVLVAALVLGIKKLLRRYKRPNGKKGGIVSLHAAIAFSTVAVVALTTKDWYLTGLTAVLAYLIARSRIEERQHYLYQVIFGVILGVAVPFGIFYMYNKRSGGGDYTYLREEYDNMPSRAHDDRHEADIEAPELRLDDEDFDF
jgi:membrane-associated phospholipid phosphatase